MSSKKPRGRQHFVPQFYLRQWADGDEKVWQYGFDGRPPAHIGIKNIAYERGLYTHPATDKVPPLHTEDNLADGESIYASVWPDIINRCQNIETRRNIAGFIALMILRHPQRRAALIRIKKAFREAVNELKPDEEVEIEVEKQISKFRVQEILDGTKDETVASDFLAVMWQRTRELAAALVVRRWGVVFSESPVFITSDCPVVLERGSCQRRTFGFGTPGTQILFPCSPKRLLVISDDWPHEFAHYKLTNADVFNRMIAQGAVRFIYGSEHDLELATKIKAWRLRGAAGP